MNELIKQNQMRINELCRRFQVRKLELFGSAATGSFDPDRSDIDFLVEFEPDAEPRLAALYLDLIAELRELLGCEVDVVLSRSVRNEHFRKSINKSRTTLYAA